MIRINRSPLVICTALSFFALYGSHSATAALEIGGTGTADCTFWCVDRLQQVYAASQFSGPTAITGVTFFAAPLNGASWDGISTWQMSMSTSVNPVGALSATFASNVGGDNAVFDTITPPAGFPLAGSPVSFTGSFYYDPNLGDLLVDIVRTAGNDFGVGLDAGLDPGAIDRAYAFNSTVTAEGLNQMGYAVRTRFDLVPEPSAAVLVCLGAMAFIGSRRRIA